MTLIGALPISITISSGNILALRIVRKMGLNKNVYTKKANVHKSVSKNQ